MRNIELSCCYLQFFDCGRADIVADAPRKTGEIDPLGRSGLHHSPNWSYWVASSQKNC